MKKSLFTSIASLVMTAFVAVAPAHATGYTPQQTASSSLMNSGSINNTVKTNATVTGAGSSYSAATGEAYSTTKGTTMTEINPVCGGTCGAVSGAVKVTGEATTGVSGTAFNVSTGNGVGSASSVGAANAALDGAAKYNGPGQEVKVNGNIDQNAAMSVVAGKNTGGVASAGNTGSFEVTGTVGSKICTGTNNCGGQVVNKEVWGTVNDVKDSTSFANTGTMTVDGVVLVPAVTNAEASSIVNAAGSYVDPQ